MLSVVQLYPASSLSACRPLEGERLVLVAPATAPGEAEDDGAGDEGLSAVRLPLSVR